MSEEVDKRIETHRGMLLGFLASHAGPALLRFDAVEDLVQGTIVEALRSSDRFELRSEEEWRAWLFTVARRHVIKRREYWFSIKRDSRAVVRLTLTGSRGDQTSLPIPDRGTGPGTRSDRRELSMLVTKAMAMLLPRDRELLRWTAEGATTRDLANRLEMNEASAGQARLRATERLRKAYRLLEQQNEQQ